MYSLNCIPVARQKHVLTFSDSLNLPDINHAAMGDTVQTDVLIVGAGPSGYVALSNPFFFSEAKYITAWTNCR
jgi:hypothetical protein